MQLTTWQRLMARLLQVATQLPGRRAQHQQVRVVLPLCPHGTVLREAAERVKAPKLERAPVFVWQQAQPGGTCNDQVQGHTHRALAQQADLTRRCGSRHSCRRRSCSR